MKSHLPPEKIMAPAALRWSWALVVASALLLGYYFLQTYASPRHCQYQLDFGQAQWIETAESPAPVAYFRKEVFLPVPPGQAWLQIAASDTFGLIVNGHTVATESSVKTFETGIYDIKRALKQGTNVIAVTVSRTSFPGSAQLLLRGQVTEPGGNVIPILSDETWRASNRTGIVLGSEEWTSQRVIEGSWPLARRSALNDEKVSLRWVETNPLLLQLPRLGYWIMAENSPSQAIFSTVILADHSKEETWIQAASSGDLDLEVNGHIVTLASTAISGAKKLPHLPTAEPTPISIDKPGRVARDSTQPKKENGSPFQTTYLSDYDISYWIKEGPNEIVAAVRSEHLPASLFVDGLMVKPDGRVARFSSSSAWVVGDRPAETDGSAQHHAVQAGKDGMSPWGFLPQEMGRSLDRSGFATLFQAWSIVSLVVAAVVALWLIASALLANGRRETLAIAMSRDALLHGPIAAGLLLFLLPNFDPRFPDQWSFQPAIVVGAVALLLLLRLLHLVVDLWTPAGTRVGLARVSEKAQWERRKERARNLISRDLRLPEFFELPFRELWPYLLLILIMFLGLGLRYHQLSYMSFDHDEMGLVAKSKGILKLGFPYTEFVNKLRWLTTYEAVPYPQAFCGFLFGYSEWSMRLPSCLMGTLCIGVIGLMGRRLFDWRTGLFAALVYACLPLNIRWGQNAFYPTQCQFASMLTFWIFYEAIRFRPFNNRALTITAVTFCLTYLSWEGTGFILPALFLGLMVVRWGEWWWLKNFHLYRCLFFMGAVIAAQYCSRMLAGSPYLQVGSGLSNLTGPSLFFLAVGYQPMFYIDKLLLSENHVFFTIMIVLGLPFCWRNPSFRYVVVVLATLFILHTNFLAALSPRYCYYFQPLVLLGGVAATIALYDRVLLLAGHAGDSSVARFAAHATGLILLLLLFVQSNESVLKEYQLSSTGDTPQMMSRLNTYRYDYRGAARYVASHARPGDVIFPGIPHVFSYYSDLPGDYFLDTLFSSKVPYNELLAEPGFIDKFGGLPVVRNIVELRSVVNRSGRAWIVFAPYTSFEKLNSPAVLDYVHENARAQFESYRAKVFLIQGAQPGEAVAQAP